MTIAGHAIEVKERAGGLLSLSIALQGATLSELAMKLTGLDGVRITRGPGEPLAADAASSLTAQASRWCSPVMA